MQALARLGIKVDESVSLDILLGENFNGKLYGLTPVQIEKVKALREVLNTYNSLKRTNDEVQITNSKIAVEVMYDTLKNLDHEEAWVAFLNRDNKILKTEMVFKGTLTDVSWSVRSVLAKALSYNASAVLLYHCHPSGNPAPSQADIKATADLKRACSLMDVELIDHIIVSKGSYFSFADEETYPHK